MITRVIADGIEAGKQKVTPQEMVKDLKPTPDAPAEEETPAAPEAVAEPEAAPQEVTS